MISRWNIVCLVLLSSPLVNGVPLGEKRETLPEGSRVYVDAKISGYEGEVHSRQRRVDIALVKDPVIVKNTGNTTVMNGSTTTQATAFEAKDMEETSVKPSGDVDDDAPGTTVKTVDKSSFNTPEKNAKMPDFSGNQTKAEEVINETVEMTTMMSTTTVEIPTSTKTPETNVTANCPGLKKTLGIRKSDVNRCPPMDFPYKGNESIEDASPEMKMLLKYNTSIGHGSNATEMTVASNTSIEIHTLPPSTSPPTTESPEVTKESREELVERSEKIKLEKKNDKGLSSGVVALIIAVAFAALAVIGYVGLTVRKRYLEYRYGNRELLVNDFDTNDINHFEL